MIKSIKKTLEKTREFNVDGEVMVDLKIADRSLCHFLGEKSGHAYSIDSGKYRVTLKVERIGEVDSEKYLF